MQLRCVTLAGQGFTNRAIAEALDIEPYTVNDHLRGAAKRLETHTRAEAAAAIGLPPVEKMPPRAGPGRPTGPTDRNLIRRIEQWAQANADDDLTLKDACVKFGCSMSSLRSRLSEAANRGTTIEVVRIIRLRRGGGS